MTNRLSINLWNWMIRCENSGLSCIDTAAELGFSAVEIPADNPSIDTGDIRRRLQKHKLESTVCAALGSGLDISSFDPDTRARTAVYLRSCVDVADAIGATLLCGPLYGGGGKAHMLSPEDRQREWDLAVLGIGKLARYAARKSIRLAVEPINRFRTSVVNTAWQAKAMCRDIHESNVGVHYDTFHACIEENDVAESLSLLLENDLLFHFHASANNRDVPGKGHLPWDALFALLKLHRYAGHITMETFLPGGFGNSWNRLYDTPEAMAVQGLTFLQKHFAPISQSLTTLPPIGG